MPSCPGTGAPDGHTTPRRVGAALNGRLWPQGFLEAPVEKGRALLLFQREGSSDWVSQGWRRQDCGKGAGIRGLTVKGRWGTAGWEGSFHLLSPMLAWARDCGN